MIFDTIKNYELYQGVSANLRAALQYMHDNDINRMEPGRYPVADGKVLVIVKKGYGTRTEEQANWENHRKNIDIQYLLEGREEIAVCRTGLLEKKTEYNEAADKQLFVNDGKGFRVRMSAGDFLVLFPDDAHATCLHPTDGPSTNNKAVIKVLIEE